MNRSLFIYSILIFVLCMFAYTVTLRPFNTTDSYPNNFTAMQILFNQKVSLTDFAEALEKRDIIRTTITNGNGERFSKTPIILGVLSVPTFAFWNAVYGVQHMSPWDMVMSEYSQYVGKLSAAMYAAISAVMVYWIGRKLLGSHESVIMSTLVFAFCSAVFNTASQANWQHAISLFFILLTLLLLLYKPNSKWMYTTIGMLVGIFCQMRISNMFYAIFIWVYLITSEKIWKQKFQNLFLVFFPALLTYSVIYLWYLVLRVPNGYGNEIGFSLSIWTFPHFVTNLGDILFSPNYGMLFFSPILGVGLIGCVLALPKSRSLNLCNWMIASLCVIVLMICFAGSWWMWTGGYSFNARLLIEIIPLLSIGVGFVWRQYKSKFMRSILVTLFIVSLFFNTLTTYWLNFHWFGNFTKAGHEYQHTAAWQLHPSLIQYALNTRVFGFDTLEQKNGDLILHQKNIRFDVKRLRFVELYSVQRVLLSKEQKNSK